MLRLEGCLRGEAAETIKGLGYSQAAYDAAISRLQRKYSGYRRKVQAQIEELRKTRPVNEGAPKSIDKFADAPERTIIVLKDNSRGFRGRNPIWNRGRETTREFA